MANEKMSPKDYPLAIKRPEDIKTPTGMNLQDIFVGSNIVLRQVRYQ